MRSTTITCHSMGVTPVEAEITLISISGKAKDAFGIPQETGYARKTVLCDVRSASRSEFYQAAQAGLHPELEVSLFFADYNGEPLVRFNDDFYKVIRTYRSDRDYATNMNSSDSDRITLTLERHIGDHPNLDDRTFAMAEGTATVDKGALEVEAEV